ncbi:MAG: PKD domain-containing protein [Actinobacteria bacterium]|nr:PKD domain-containing protein [Actinomycetota bacterium]
MDSPGKSLKNKINTAVAILLCTLIMVAVTSCCAPFENLADKYGRENGYEDSGFPEDDYSGKEPGVIDGDLVEENVKPLAVMDIYQQGSDGYFLVMGNPVFFNAGNSSDADGDELSFSWDIGGVESVSQEYFSYTFFEEGDYSITLKVFDGTGESVVTKTVRVIETNRSIMVTREHQLTLKIEHTFKNRGPGDIRDLFCLIGVPQTYQPYQVVIDRKSDYAESDEVFAEGYNVIAQFKLGDLEAGQSVKACIDCDLLMYEYDYAGPEEAGKQYEAGDKDLEIYTAGEYFIDSGSSVIKSTAKSVAGNETDPVTAAEKLYNFVIDRLDYDYARLEGENTGFETASRLLQEESGICTDYSILYTALCRASGIPAVVAQGISVFGILNETDKELPYGHAWVEIKLPGYGWIPIDITPEGRFMGYNYFLNLQTYKGSGIFYESLEIGDEKYYPTGFYYSWNGDEEPEVTEKISYSVSGMDLSDLNAVAENEFLNGINGVLSGYSGAIKDLNNSHGTDWIFNDPGEVAKEEVFLERLKELSGELKGMPVPETFAADLSNMFTISTDIISHKEDQVNCMKSGDYDCSTMNYNLFVDSTNSLFEYYNNMVNRYNEKY